MPKTFKTWGKIYFLEGDLKYSPLSIPFHTIYRRRLVFFEIDGLPICALCVLPSIKKVPSKIVLDEQTEGNTLFCGVLENKTKKNDGWDVIIEYSPEYLLQLLDHEPYLTDEQRQILLNKISE